MSALTALLSALAYGTGDFLGGVATRKAGSVVPVIFFSHLVGLGVVGLLLVVVPGEATTRALVTGSGAGVVGALGFAMLYRGLAVGRMTVVAPVTALLSAAVPLGWSLLTGERPAAVALVGAGIGLVAIPLVAVVAGDDAVGGTMGVKEAVGAGVAFAVFFIALDGTGDGSGVVPLLAARLASVPLFALGALVLRIPLRLTSGARGAAVGAGALDMAANALFLASTRLGFLAVVAVLVSLYPAMTVVLARFVLHERVSAIQKTGLAIGAVGVVLMALG